MDDSSWHKRQYGFPNNKHELDHIPRTAKLCAGAVDGQPEIGQVSNELLQRHQDMCRVGYSASRRVEDCEKLTRGRINLAYAELYIILGNIFRKYDIYDGTGKQQEPTLALYDTIRERDVDAVRDLLATFSEKGSKGVRITVREGNLS